MRVVFMGTPEFAVPSLEALASRHDVVAVYTRPDKPRGRGRSPRPSPVKVAAWSLGVPVLQPPSLRPPDESERLAGLEADVVCVAAFGMILPAGILAVPRHGCLNVHASLLPRWRGAAPVQRAILAGDDTTGVSIMRIEESLDTGPYAAQAVVPVDDLDASALTAELARAGARLLLDVLDRVEEGTAIFTAQDESRVTYAEKVSAADVALAPGLSATEGLRRVRASGPSSHCRLRIGGATLTVLEASPSSATLKPGEVAVSRDAVEIGMADGSVTLRRVKPEGRAEMTAAAWARGARLGDGVSWSAATVGE